MNDDDRLLGSTPVDLGTDEQRTTRHQFGAEARKKHDRGHDPIREALIDPDTSTPPNRRPDSSSKSHTPDFERSAA